MVCDGYRVEVGNGFVVQVVKAGFIYRVSGFPGVEANDDERAIVDVSDRIRRSATIEIIQFNGNQGIDRLNSSPGQGIIHPKRSLLGTKRWDTFWGCAE